MTISYPDTQTTPAAETGVSHVPIYARKPPKKKATPWLMAAPVALAAVGAVAWIALSSDREAPSAPAETVELTGLVADGSATTADEFTRLAPLDPVRPVAATPAPVEAAPAPVRRTAAPAPRRAAVHRVALAPAPVQAEEVVPTGPQPYLVEAEAVPASAVEVTAVEPEPVLITPQPLD